MVYIPPRPDKNTSTPTFYKGPLPNKRAASYPDLIH